MSELILRHLCKNDKHYTVRSEQSGLLFCIDCSLTQAKLEKNTGWFEKIFEKLWIKHPATADHKGYNTCLLEIRKELQGGMILKRNKVILRLVEYPMSHSTRNDFDIFEGDIEKDRKYWKNFHKINARYFELKELLGG